jgi:hypothetical protein
MIWYYAVPYYTILCYPILSYVCTMMYDAMPGGTISWKNNDQMVHTVSSYDPSAMAFTNDFDCGDIQPAPSLAWPRIA